MTKYSLEHCDAITELCSGLYYLQKEYPKHAFEQAVLWDFEGVKMPLPQGYDIYLSTAFGDYMQLPPKDKRKPHHEASFIDLETPYREYRGERYLCN